MHDEPLPVNLLIEEMVIWIFVLQFLTLPPGDERSRLVPVLQKILTLSSDETHKVQAIAKGKSINFYISNLNLISIKILPFPSFQQILEALRVGWRSSTPRIALTPKRRK